jgi:Tfp pilus assembly protein PilO
VENPSGPNPDWRVLLAIAVVVLALALVLGMGWF